MSSRAPDQLRVLVVDDDVHQCALVELVLRHCGVSQVARAVDGPTGLALMAEAAPPFDIVVSDLKMPGMDGIEFMRRAGAVHHCRFILMSALEAALLGSAAQIVRDEAIALLGVLPKPVTPAAMAPMLARFQAVAAMPAAPLERLSKRRWSRNALAGALADGQFLPYFQPKFSLATGQVDGVEILARWQHPQLGLLAPAEFISRMEEEDLIDALTESIFSQALACARRWLDQGIALPLALNLSVHTLQRPGFAHQLAAVVEAAGMAAQSVTLEVTETAQARDPRKVQEHVIRLRLLGFKIAVDDFGVGYSSLLKLSECPFTELKIDRAFVSDMSASSKSRPILEAILALTAKLGMRTVAEGIETSAEYEAVKALGCTAGQGFFMAMPMDEAQLLRWYAGLRGAGRPAIS